MPIDTNVYIIPTGLLNQVVNVQREHQGLIKLEDTLISRKLGILFAVKNTKYINFQNEPVELNTSQIAILNELINHYFNVDIANYIDVISMKPEKQAENMDPNKTSSLSTDNKGFFHKLTGLVPKITTR